MTSVKTAISIQRSLFEKVNNLAREMDISRSRVFVMAVEEYLQRYQNRQLLAEINQAYKDSPTPDEQKYLEQMRQQQRRVIDEW
jgi:metal-responsive CopG/Arc/MetJ family transcriptional regulator